MDEETRSSFRQQSQVHGQEDRTSVDDTDLLIRSTTTILHLLGHRVAETKDRPANALKGQFLDRVALCFVSGIRPAGAAAVIHEDYANRQFFVNAVHESNSYGAVKNVSARTVPSSHALTHPPDPNPMQLLEEDMISFFHLQGVGAITVEMHAQKLQSLLNAIHKGEEARTTAAKDKLSQYIYTFCALKFWDRLSAHATSYEQEMLSFFLNADYSGPKLSREQLARDIPPTSKLKDKSETWLSDMLEDGGRIIPCHDVNLGGGRTGQHLALDKENIWHLYSLFTTTLQALRVKLMKIKPLAQATAKTTDLEQKERKEFIDALDDIHGCSSLIYDLIHKSPSFWRMIELLGSTISPRNPNQPARTSQLPSALRTQPGSQLASPNKDGETAEVIQDDETEIAEEIQDDETEVAEDEIGLIESCTFAELCGRWLDSITQWFHVVEDLCERADIRAIVKRGLVIKARDAMAPEDSHRQMPLMRTLEKVSGRKLEDVYLAITELAKNKAESLRLNNPTARLPQARRQDTFLALEVLAGFSETSPGDWEGAFSGAVHCEADLICQMASQNKEVKDRLIGVSKHCCFCCDVLLKHLGLDSTSLPTHGKIYYWAPPPTATAEAKQAVLKELLSQLEKVIEDFYSEKEDQRPSTGDSGKGSESDRVSSNRRRDTVKSLLKIMP
ncbi:hypothetical protein FRC04_000925 [Tulasnella sp. 424]|nr:hypothetical protein FRC04_000925 [Tulasnella sp. 424]KAG8977841.1 hypothetical protein FRC05_000369 [Tulasnella sp. 425]